MNPSYPGVWSSSPVILCVVCLADNKVPPGQSKAAVAIVQGYSVCTDHAEVIGFSKEINSQIKKRWDDEDRAAKRGAEIERKTVT